MLGLLLGFGGRFDVKLAFVFSTFVGTTASMSNPSPETSQLPFGQLSTLLDMMPLPRSQNRYSNPSPPKLQPPFALAEAMARSAISCLQATKGKLGAH
jgi:hypothetical protein